MQIRYIPATTTLLAGAITCIISILNKFDVLYSLKVLLTVLIIFYILGVIAQKIIFAVMKSGAKVNNMEEETDNNDEELEEDTSEIKTDNKIDEA